MDRWAARRMRMGSLWSLHVALLAVVTTGLGCLKDESSKPGPATETAAENVAPTAPPKKRVDTATAGVLTGTVSFGGPLPEATMIRASSDAACAKARPGEFSAQDVQVKDGRVANAFVWIASGLDEYAFDAPEGPVRVDQRGCMFEPTLAVAWVGQTIEFANSDPTMHNVSAKPQAQRTANIATPQGKTGRMVFKTPEVPIKLGCDVHPWMRAYVGVVQHPFIAVTGPNGAFRFEGVPPGTYIVAGWHERLGVVERRVTLAPKGQAAVDMKLPGEGLEDMLPN